MASITVPHSLMLERILTLEIVRVTERAAVNAARLRGRGEEKAADQAAVDAMRRELNNLPIDGTVVIGEGELDEAPMLFIGEKVGSAGRLQGRYCRRSAGRHDAVRQEHAGRHRHAGDRRARARCCTPPTSIWTRSRSDPAIREGVVDLDAPADENVRALAKAKGVKPDAITAMVLDRPRHADIIAAVRKVGASVSLITDGDVAGVIHTAEPDKTGIDIYLGIGGAPEGVLAAAALRCIGGQMQCRLVLDTQERRERSAKMGISDPRKKYQIEDMVRGDCLFAATGITDGRMLDGVRFGKEHRRDRDRRHALDHRHRALDQGRTPAAGEVLGVSEPVTIRSPLAESPRRRVDASRLREDTRSAADGLPASLSNMRDADS